MSNASRRFGLRSPRAFGAALFLALSLPPSSIFIGVASAQEARRGVSVQAVGKAAHPSEGDANGEAGGGLEITPLTPKSMTGAPGQFSVTAPSPAAPPPKPKEPIRLAFRGSGPAQPASGAMSPFEIVALDARPDVIWDASSRDVLAGGEVLAHDVDAKNLNAIVDRMAAVRWLKLYAGTGPQPIRIFPNERLHHKGATVEVSVGGVQGRHLLLFNIAGDGAVQFLYPLGSDPHVVEQPEYRTTVAIREPLGADQLVAIVSDQRQLRLEQGLKQLDRLRTPAKVIDILSQNIGADARVGTIGLFTAR
jgi:hypothetical protein